VVSTKYCCCTVILQEELQQKIDDLAGEQFSVSQREQTKHQALLENAQDIKVQEKFNNFTDLTLWHYF